MDKDKLRQLIINTWKDGNSQFHDQKGSIDYDADLEVWFDTIEDDINELCGGECSNENSGLNIPVVVQQRELLIAYHKYHSNGKLFACDEAEIDEFLQSN